MQPLCVTNQYVYIRRRAFPRLVKEMRVTSIEIDIYGYEMLVILSHSLGFSLLKKIKRAVTQEEV